MPIATPAQQRRLLLLRWHCCYCRGMGVAVTVRDVPENVRDELAARAARAGQSLQEYLRTMLVERASRPSVDDVIARARRRVETTGVRTGAESILAARDAERR
jgi:plasmid stability protein